MEFDKKAKFKIEFIIEILNMAVCMRLVKKIPTLLIFLKLPYISLKH